MGIGYQAINLTLSLWMDGCFNGFKRVIELGAQDIDSEPDGVDHVLSRLTRTEVRTRDPHTPKGDYPPRAFYKALGFDEYKCIDADGRNGALVMDLNKDLAGQGLTDEFDLVTNHGTTEHCFDQCSCFRNMHNLCARGGIMIHGLPCQGYLNHGFFNYHPNFFYDLARANGYDVIRVYLNLDADSADLMTYSSKVMEFLSITPLSTVLLFVVLKKTTTAEFQSPWDGRFASTAGAGLRNEYRLQEPAKLYLPWVVTNVDSIPARQMFRALAIKTRRRIARLLG